MARNMKPRRADFYPDDWLAGTLELTLEEEGAYIRICALVYSKGQAISDNDRWLAGMCRVSTRKWRTLRNSLVAKGKITIENGLIRQERCEFELGKAVERSRKQAENVTKRWRKRAESELKVNRENDEAGRNPLENKETGDTTVIPAHALPPTTNHQPPKKTTSGTISPVPSSQYHNGGQKEDSVVCDGSSEDMFWSLADKAAAVNVTRGLMGKLAVVVADFDTAYPALLGALGKKNPPAYVAKIIKNETQEQGARDAALLGRDTGEPDFVQEAYRDGLPVERLPEGTWRIAGTIYDATGEDVGW